jgi:hypothetical protein
MSKMMKLAAVLLLTVPLISCSRADPHVEVNREAFELEERPALPNGTNASRARYILETEEWGEGAIETHDAALDVLCKLAVCVEGEPSSDP